MKNKFSVMALTSLLLVASTAIAQEAKNEDNFAKRKAEVVANLNQEKSITDQGISCVNGAQKREDLEKCRDQKRASMDALKQKMIGDRKANLQNQIQKLDQKSSELSNKNRQ